MSDDLNDLDWLRDPNGGDEGVPSSDDDDLALDWLKSPSSGEFDQPVADDDDLALDWLRASPDDSGDGIDTGDDAVPDWMADVETEADDLDLEIEADDESVPDWMADVETEADDLDLEIETDDESIPDWMMTDEVEPEREERAPVWVEDVDDDLFGAVESDESPEDEYAYDEDGDMAEFFEEEPAFAEDDALLSGLLESAEEVPVDDLLSGEVDDFFSEMAGDMPDFDDGLFGDVAFDLETGGDDDQFDVLGDMLAGADDTLAALLDTAGGGEVDLLSELTGGDAAPQDSGEFDLLGALAETGEPEEFDLLDELSETGEIDVIDVRDEFDRLDEAEALEMPVEVDSGQPDDDFVMPDFIPGGEETPEVPVGAVPSLADDDFVMPDLPADVHKPGIPGTTAAIRGLLDEDDESGMMGLSEILQELGDEVEEETAEVEDTLPDELEPEEAEEALAWLFDDETPTPAEAAPAWEDTDDGAWMDALGEPDLDALGDEDEFEQAEAAPLEPVYADVDDFLATLDDAGGFSIGEGDLAEELDLDAFFDDDSLGVEAAELPLQELSEDAPEWLADISKEAKVDEHSAAAIVRRRKDRPLEGLSDRLLTLRDRGLELPIEQEHAALPEAETVLSNISGTLAPIAMETAPDAALVQAFTPTERQHIHAGLLREIVGSSVLTDTVEGEVAIPTVRRRRVRIRLERFLITAILLGVMALPFFDVGLMGDLPPAKFAAGSPQEAFFKQVDLLQPGEWVLVAAEYGPTGAAELDSAAAAVIRHVLARRAHPVVVGGNPAGLLHVYHVIQDIAAQNAYHTDLVRNDDYTIGRYLVGDALGLRQWTRSLGENSPLARDLWGEETGLQIDTLDDFSLIIIISESAERLRAWAEQVAPETTAPVLLVTGYGGEPLSAPYISMGGDTAGILVGYADGQTYHHLLDVMLELLPTATPTPPPTGTPELLPTESPMPEPTLTDDPAVQPSATPEQPAGAPTDAPTTEETAEIIPPTATPTATATHTPTTTSTPTATHTPTATPTPEPVRFAVVIAEGAVNIRSEPDGAIVATAQPGESMLIVGENADASWFNVLLPNGAAGWVAAFLVRVDVVMPETQDSPVTPGADAGREKQVVFAKVFAQPQPIRTPVPQGAPPLLPDHLVPFQTPTPTPTPTLTPTPTPTLEYASVEDVEGRVMRVVVYDQGEERDTRWYIMTVGILAAVLVIAVGNVFNMLRFLARGLRDRRQGR